MEKSFKGKRHFWSVNPACLTIYQKMDAVWWHAKRWPVNRPAHGIPLFSTSVMGPKNLWLCIWARGLNRGEWVQSWRSFSKNSTQCFLRGLVPVRFWGLSWPTNWWLSADLLQDHTVGVFSCETIKTFSSWPEVIVWLYAPTPLVDLFIRRWCEG